MVCRWRASLRAVLVVLAVRVCFAQLTPGAALRVGTSGDYAPFSFHAPSGELTGFDVVVAQRLGHDLGRSVEFVPFQWPDLTGRLRTGAFDVAMSGVTVRADRDDLELEVSAPGCAPWRSETLAALDGATQDIHLPLEARLRVRIGAATGEPLVGAQVLVVGSRLGLVPAQSTDARGFTEFTRLPEGDVRVSVVVPGQAPAEQCIALRSGERSELEFRMPGD